MVLSFSSNFVLIWFTLLKIAISIFLTFGLKLPNHAHFWGVLGCFDTLNNVFVIKTPKRHILGWIRVVWCIDRVYPSTRLCCRRRREKGRKGKVHFGYISPIWGEDPFGPISTKIGTLVGIHDVIIYSKFGFNILRRFRSTGGRNFRFPIEFAGHRYNSAGAAATAQPVILNIHWSEFVTNDAIRSRTGQRWPDTWFGARRQATVDKTQ